VTILADTHVLLWAAGQSKSLPRAARVLIEAAGEQRWFSVVNLWEVAIKRALQRTDFEVDTRRLRRGLLENGWRELQVSGEHVLAIQDLPALHKDPFDRMLLAQAHVEGLVLLTSDERVAQYPGRVRKV
jgi:PIN domain nuclease of toxin-antitoxin system